MELDEFFPYQLAIASEAFSRNLAEVYGSEYGLNREEWRLLFLLSRAGRLTSNELARRTTLDKVQVSRASQRLEKKRLITRDVPAQDRRLREYTCTAAGRRLFDRILPLVRARADEMLAQLSPDDRAALQQGVMALAVALGAREPAEADETATGE